MEIIQLNFIYAALGCLLGLVSILLSFFLLDLLAGFRLRASLRNGNRAVALMAGAALISFGLCFGLIIGMSLN